MHLLTVLGTRPEIIRLSVLLRDLRCSNIKSTVVFTNQNSTDILSTVFIKELSVKIDYYLPKLEMTTPGK
jgi:UDP-N-acetylglucosamine 2-epimerase (non-hydrolysing)